MFANLLTDDIEKTKDLFVKLLDYEIEYESDWFISMKKSDEDRVGALLKTCEFVPDKFQKSTQGVMLTVIVDDVDVYFQRAKKMGVNIIEEPRDLPYGQRRLLVLDASGALVDISSPTAEPDPEYT